MKKYITTLMCLLFSIGVWAQTSGYCGDELTWEFEESSGTLTIEGTGEMWGWFTSSSGGVPWSHLLRDIKHINMGDGMTSIGNYAFQNCTDLLTVAFPKQLTSIGYNAFRRCSMLRAVDLPDGVIAIKDGAFSDCIKLTSATIPTSATRIGAAFSGCINLTSVVLEQGETTVIDEESFMEGTFLGCSSLTSISIPEGIKYIGNNTFYNCNSLTSITVPKSVSSIGRKAFEGCDNLTILHYDAIECSSILNPEWVNLKTVIIGDSVKEIPDYAFGGCYSLSTVQGNKNVIRVGDQAFDNTPWFNNQSDGVLYIGRALYKYKGTMLSKTSLQIKDGTVSVTDKAFSGCENLISVTIPESLTMIGNSAFSSCGLTSVTIHKNMAYIGGYAFSCKQLASVEFNAINCEMGVPYSVYVFNQGGVSVVKEYEPKPVFAIASLISVTIGNQVKSINALAFSGCTGLTTISIPNSVEKIGNYAFSDCSSLKYVNISNSVKNIGRDAFKNTAWLDEQQDGLVYAGKVLLLYKGSMPNKTEIQLAEGTLGIGPNAFSEYTGLSSIFIPSSVGYIGERAFYGCNNLTSVQIPDNIEKIDYESFGDCTRLNYVSLPNKVRVIEERAFFGCLSLDSITIPETVENIGKYAFSECRSLRTLHYNAIDCSIYSSEGWAELREVIFGNNVRKISNYAFYACHALKSIVIPDATVSIGEGAFMACSNLTNVTLGKNLTTIEDEAFAGCNFTSVVIPNQVVNIGGEAFRSCDKLSSITLGTSLSNIGYDVFYKCNNLQTIISLNSHPPFVEYNLSTSGIPSTCKLKIPAGSLNSYLADDVWKYLFNIEELPVVDDNVAITTDSNSAKVSWVASANAKGYVLSIYKDVTRTEPFAEYYLDTNGNILKMTSTDQYLSCAINDLKSWTSYHYSLVAYDETAAIGLTEGVFETKEASGIEMEDVNQAKGLIVYPNPVQEYFYILGLSSKANMTVFNTSGKIVLEKIVEPNEEISMEGMPAGTYLVRIQNKTLKIIKY